MGRPGAFAPLKRWGGLAGPRARFFGSRPPGWGSGGLGQPGGRWRVLAAIGSGGRKFLGGAGGGPAAVSSSARRQSRLPHMGLRPRQVRELAEKSRRRWGGTKIHVCRICGTRKCMGSRGKEILDLTSKAKGVFKETGKGKPIYKGPPQTLRPPVPVPPPPTTLSAIGPCRLVCSCIRCGFLREKGARVAQHRLLGVFQARDFGCRNRLMIIGRSASIIRARQRKMPAEFWSRLMIIGRSASIIRARQRKMPAEFRSRLMIIGRSASINAARARSRLMIIGRAASE